VGCLLLALVGLPTLACAADFFGQTVVVHRTWVNEGNSIHRHFPDPETMSKHITPEGLGNEPSVSKVPALLVARRSHGVRLDCARVVTNS